MQDDGKNTYEGSEGSSNPGGLKCLLHKSAGDLECDHDDGYEEDSDNMGKLWNVDPGRRMPQALLLDHRAPLRSCASQ